MLCTGLTLHWLPASFRSDFQALLVVSEVLNGLAPLCITHCLSFYVYSHTMRSSAACLLKAPNITTLLLCLPPGYVAAMYQIESVSLCLSFVLFIFNWESKIENLKNNLLFHYSFTNPTRKQIMACFSYFQCYAQIKNRK